MQGLPFQAFKHDVMGGRILASFETIGVRTNLRLRCFSGILLLSMSLTHT